MSSVSQSTVCFNVKFIMNYKLQILFILQSSVGVSDEMKMVFFVFSRKVTMVLSQNVNTTISKIV